MTAVPHVRLGPQGDALILELRRLQWALPREWQEARRMVDELIPGYADFPFWIEPQTRVCRARMLIAEGDVAQAVADANRAAALGREGRSFQRFVIPAGNGYASLCSAGIG